MKIVIDIPDSTIADLKRKKNRTEVDNAVLNGTPLPKGHGRLISAQDLIDDFGIAKSKKVNGDSTSYDEWLGYDIKKYIDNAPTIIEP